ncbi:MAG: dihydrodipicolinate synthase family protein [Bilophila wadsworthia]
MKQIHGIFAVTVTHFQENGEIDYAACAKHINWLIESGVHGLLPLGATGEFSALTLEERKAFAEFAMKEVAGRVPVIIGAVSTNVDVTLEVAKHAASIGADGVMILPPPGLHPSQDEIYAFYKHISENVTLPVMIYNNPGSSGVNILPETLDKIADLPHMGFRRNPPATSCASPAPWTSWPTAS